MSPNATASEPAPSAVARVKRVRTELSFLNVTSHPLSPGALTGRFRYLCFIVIALQRCGHRMTDLPDTVPKTVSSLDRRARGVLALQQLQNRHTQKSHAATMAYGDILSLSLFFATNWHNRLPRFSCRHYGCFSDFRRVMKAFRAPLQVVPERP